MKRLNNSGFAHMAVLATLVVGAAVFGAYSVVSSHANALNAKAAPHMTTTMGVRTAQSGPYYQDASLNIDNGSTVQFSVDLTNETKETVKNVRVRATLPSGITATPGSLVLDTVALNSELSNIPAGDFTPGQHKLITYSAMISPKAVACTAKGLTPKIIVSAPKLQSSSRQVTVKTCSNNSASTVKPSVAVKTPAKATPKAKASITLVSGARGDGVRIGFIPQIVAQVGDTLEFNTTVTNSGPLDIKNVFVVTKGLIPTGLTPVPGSLMLDGKPAVNSILTHTTIGALPVKASHVISYKAIVGTTTYSRCGDHKYKINTMVVAAGVPTQQATVTMEVCPKV